MRTRLALAALASLGALVLLAGCGGSKISQEDVERLNAANERVGQSFQEQGQAVITCSSSATTEEQAADCVDENFARVEPVVEEALAEYDAVLEEVDDEQCRSALEEYRGNVAEAGSLIEQAREAARQRQWERLQQIGTQLQTSFVQQFESGEEALLAACDLEPQEGS